MCVRLTKTSRGLYPLWQMGLGMREGDDKMALATLTRELIFIHHDVSVCVLKLRNIRM